MEMEGCSDCGLRKKLKEVRKLRPGGMGGRDPVHIGPHAH